MTNVERVKLARETELMLRSQFNQGREITPEDEIQCDILLSVPHK